MIELSLPVGISISIAVGVRSFGLRLSQRHSRGAGESESYEELKKGKVA